jgi:hypothetical protein
LRGALFGLAALAVGLVSGCDGTASDAHRVTEIQELRSEIERQQRQLTSKDEQIRDQDRIIQELRDLGGERSLNRLVHVSRVELGSLSGGHDEDGDGVDESVRLYLRLRDQDGDLVKVAGSAHVRLFDLANPEGSQLVGEVELDPDQLRQTWHGRFLTYHYTITLPWAGGADRAAHPSITIHVRFTGLLTGRTCETQEVVEVRGAGPTTGGTP